jgi:hypothetical protein
LILFGPYKKSPTLEPIQYWSKIFIEEEVH